MLNMIFYIMFIFILFSFIGWILEEVYSYFIDGEFKKDGFLCGPFKPMYGIAMSLTTIVYGILEIRGLFLWILLFIIPTAVEYFSGYLLKHFFNKEYWSYGNIRFNYKGLICLKFSTYWFLLISVTTILVEPLLLDLYWQYRMPVNILSLGLFFYIYLDVIESIKTKIKTVQQ